MTNRGTGGEAKTNDVPPAIAEISSHATGNPMI